MLSVKNYEVPKLCSAVELFGQDDIAGGSLRGDIAGEYCAECLNQIRIVLRTRTLVTLRGNFHS